MACNYAFMIITITLSFFIFCFFAAVYDTYACKYAYIVYVVCIILTSWIYNLDIESGV